MKKIFSAMTLLFLLIACTKKESGFQLSGNIKGIKQGVLYLQQLKDSNLVVLDSAIFDGKDSFTLKAELTEPEMLYLFLDKGQTNSIDNNLPFFAEPKAMTLQTNLEAFFADAKLEGSESHVLYEQYLSTLKQFKDRDLEFFEQQIRAQKLKKQDRIDSIQILKDQNLKRMYLYAINYAIGRKNSPVAAYIAVSDLNDTKTKFLDTIHQSLTPEVKSTKYAKMLEKTIQERKKNSID
jgi:hypothetical protein